MALYFCLYKYFLRIRNNNQKTDLQFKRYNGYSKSIFEYEFRNKIKMDRLHISLFQKKLFSPNFQDINAFFIWRFSFKNLEALNWLNINI